MAELLWFLLPGIIALGIITSYEDIRIGKIRNKWIILAIAYALIINSLFYAFDLSNITLEHITNIIFAIILGFGLWYFKIWTAGDGKLFIAFSALIPLSSYNLGYYKWIPSLTLIINIFVPALLIMIILMITKIKTNTLKKVLKSLKEDFSPKKLLRRLFGLFAIFWIVQLLLSLCNINENYLVSIVFTVLLFTAAQKFEKISLYIFILITISRFILDKTIYSWNFLLGFITLFVVWFLFYSFFRKSLSKLSHELFSKQINIKNLKPGMILAEKKKKMSFIDEEAEGLTKNQIKKIKSSGIKRIRISHTIPFAPFIFLGIILTLVANGNILISVFNLLG